MRMMYTKTPDEGCHEFDNGIFGRPIRTDQQGQMRRDGWTYSINEFKGESDVRKKQSEEKPERQEEVEVSDDLVAQYVERFGKKPHHKMKAETIIQKLSEADD